jgi:rubrerythrin
MEVTLKTVMTVLESWFDIFNNRYFEGKLERPVIAVNSDTTSGAFGWCTVAKVWKGTNKEYYEINICAEHLNRPVGEIVATLLHEMVHLHNLQNAIKDTSRGNTYHNKNFKIEAEKRGLIIDRHPKYGWTLTKLNPDTEEFIKTLDTTEFGLYRVKFHKAEATGTSKKSSSRKYICPSCGMSVRATKEVKIMCMECEEQMLTEDDEEDEE